MSDFELEITMPDEHRKLLLELVNSAKKEKVISVIWFVHIPDAPPIYLSYTIGQRQIDDKQFPEDPMPGFEALGFFKKLEQEKKYGTYYFLPKAYKWADYQNKGAFLKWITRIPSNIRDIAIFIAFVLSLGLTTLQILELIGIIKKTLP